MSSSSIDETETFRCSAYNSEWRKWLEALNDLDKGKPGPFVILSSDDQGICITGRDATRSVLVMAHLLKPAFIHFYSHSHGREFRFPVQSLIKHLRARNVGDIVHVYHTTDHNDDIQVVSHTANGGQISRIGIHLLEDDEYDAIPNSIVDLIKPKVKVVMNSVQTAEWRQALKGLRELTASTDNIDTDPTGIIKFKLDDDRVVLSPNLGDEKSTNIPRAVSTISVTPVATKKGMKWMNEFSNFKAPLIYKFFSYTHDELVLYYCDNASPLCCRYPLSLPPVKGHNVIETGYIEIAMAPMIEIKDEVM